MKPFDLEATSKTAATFVLLGGTAQMRFIGLRLSGDVVCEYVNGIGGVQYYRPDDLRMAPRKVVKWCVFELPRQNIRAGYWDLQEKAESYVRDRPESELVAARIEWEE